MARNLNIRHTIISLVILILLIFLGLGAIKIFNQKKEAIKIDARAKFEHPDDEVEALREINPCSGDPNWETPNYTQDGPLYNSSLICNCCSPGVVKCRIVDKLLVKGEDRCGKIPPSLATLPYLGAVDFTWNYLSGGIPPEWTSMKDLNYLSLYANNLSGPIPIYLGNMTFPVYVRLDNSMFCGTIPPEVAKLFNKEHLILAAFCQAMFNNAFNSTINMHDYDRQEYKENKLAVQYGPNACLTGYVKGCHPNPLPNFTIHGLWPKTISPRKNVTFDENVLKGQLLRDLHYYWPNLRNDYDKTFWALEWVKHGPDYNVGDGSQLAYFNQTVNLFGKDEIREALSILGAEEKRSFMFNDTLEQLKRITTPELVCKKFEKEGETLLVEIRFCLGNNLQNLTDCQPSNISASCNPEFFVYYLPPKK